MSLYFRSNNLGRVITIADGIAIIQGLTDVCIGELVEFKIKNNSSVEELNSTKNENKIIKGLILNLNDISVTAAV